MQVFGDKQARENTGIDRDFGGGPYPIGRDIALVELSCSSSASQVTRKLKNCSSRSLENVSFYWKASNTSSRVPVALEFGSTASAFPEDSPATYDAVFGYTTEIMTTPMPSRKSFRLMTSTGRLLWRSCRRQSTSTVPLECRVT